MAANPLTLAALATAAVPGIELVGVVDDDSDRDLESSAVRDSEGRVLRVLVPRTPGALARLQEQATALGAFGRAARERLPFEVPAVIGQSPLQRSLVMVTTRLPGTAISVRDLGPENPGLGASIGAALAALHELPTSIVLDAGLPHRTVPAIRTELLDVFDRAATTGKVPATLLARWESALEDAALWQFTPRVTHGDLQAPGLRRQGTDVVGIDGWHALGLGDPAKDLAWILSSTSSTFVDETFSAYVAERSGDRQLRRRAMLHAELEVARWLLHGVSSHDQTIIDDATDMLRSLVGRVAEAPDAATLEAERLATMDLSDVQAMLDERGTTEARTVPNKAELDTAEITPAERLHATEESTSPLSDQQQMNT